MMEQTLSALDSLFTLDFVLFFVAGVGGMVFHWWKRSLRRQTSSSLYVYLFVNNPRYTAYAFATYVVAIIGMVALGEVTIGSKGALVLAATTGYGIDSLINRDLEKDKEHDDVRDSF
jgi:hypothetical protein